MKLKVTKGELIISNNVETADQYLLGGARGAPHTLTRVKQRATACCIVYPGYNRNIDKPIVKKLNCLADQINYFFYTSINTIKIIVDTLNSGLTTEGLDINETDYDFTEFFQK